MAEEEAKKKINFKKIALFGLGPIVLIGIGLGVGAFLFMPTQTPVEQVEELIEKKLQQAGQLPSAEGEEEAASYNKFSCFCKDTTKEKQESITKREDADERLTGNIADKNSHRNELDDDIKDLE